MTDARRGDDDDDVHVDGFMRPVCNPSIVRVTNERKARQIEKDASVE